MEKGIGPLIAIFICGWGWSSAICWQTEMEPYVWGHADPPQHACERYGCLLSWHPGGVFFFLLILTWAQSQGWIINNDDRTCNKRWFMTWEMLLKCFLVWIACVCRDADYWFWRGFSLGEHGWSVIQLYPDKQQQQGGLLIRNCSWDRSGKMEIRIDCWILNSTEIIPVIPAKQSQTCLCGVQMEHFWINVFTRELRYYGCF